MKAVIWRSVASYFSNADFSVGAFPDEIPVMPAPKKNMFIFLYHSNQLLDLSLGMPASSPLTAVKLVDI